MKISRRRRDAWISVVLWSGAMITALAAVSRSDAANSLFENLDAMACLAAIAAAASAYRPLGEGTLGLGAMTFPVLLVSSGLGASAAQVATHAALAMVGTEVLARLIRRRLGIVERRSAARSLDAAARVAVAALAGAAVWRFAVERRPLVASDPLSFVAATTVAALLYVTVLAALETAERWLRRPERELRFGFLRPLGLDVVGWIFGAFAARSALAAPLATVVLLALVGLLGLVLGVAAQQLEQRKSQIRDLERLGTAGRRMFAAGGEMAAVAEQISIECHRVCPSHWFQFELLAPDVAYRSWWSRSGGSVFDGVPAPEDRPPALLGFHRRGEWELVERELSTESTTERASGRVRVARVRLWCDDRQLDPERAALLDRLLPQMAASVARALLDREAREDPLTGAVVRRVLERRLQEVYGRAVEDGGAMAVILCDLDHFKRINDTHGHAAGDRALVAAAEVLLAARREGDLCCRYGGEEFALLLEDLDGDAAMLIAERIRQAIEAIELESEGHPIPLAVSAGVAAFPELYVKAPGELLLFADEALYEAKRRGRNQCLKNLGQGRYRTISGEIHTTAEARPAPAPPRVFA